MSRMLAGPRRLAWCSVALRLVRGRRPIPYQAAVAVSPEQMEFAFSRLQPAISSRPSSTRFLIQAVASAPMVLEPDARAPWGRPWDRKGAANTGPGEGNGGTEENQAQGQWPRVISSLALAGHCKNASYGGRIVSEIKPDAVTPACCGELPCPAPLSLPGSIRSLPAAMDRPAILGSFQSAGHS